MVRIDINLDPQEYELAKREAHNLGISVAEFVRRTVRDRLPTQSGAPSNASWMHYAGLVESGDPDSSQTIDDLIYGVKD